MAYDNLDKLDRQRERWRSARRCLHLDDVNDESFALGGSGTRVKELSVRILILTTDPLEHRFDFDERFLEKWQAANLDPVTAQPPWWGGSTGATSATVVKYDLADDNLWNRYVAVDHSGSLDIGLGCEACWSQEGNRFFNLVTIVGRLWAVCHLHAGLAEALPIAGPGELVVALRGTEGAILSGFAHGWLEPLQSNRGVSVCREPNLLIRREIAERDGDWARETAFSVGRQIENAFGSTLERFRAINNNVLGDFDKRRYSWH